jgi:lysophospholipase
VSYTLSEDKTRLFYKIDHADSAGVSALIIHGFGDHSERYDTFTTYLNELGISVLRFDYRGHGRSEGKKGHILSFEEYIQDLEAAIDIFEESFPDSKRILLGHSNGALIATHGLALIPKLHTWDAAVLSSPFFAIKVKVPRWKSFLGQKLSRLIPTMQLPTDLNPKHMSHDPEVIKAYSTDPLIGRVASARWFTEILKAHAQLEERLQQIKIPVLMQIAGEDYIADSEVSKNLFNSIRSADKHLSLYEGLYHEIWFEDISLNRKVFAELEEFLHNQSLVTAVT